MSLALGYGPTALGPDLPQTWSPDCSTSCEIREWRPWNAGCCSRVYTVTTRWLDVLRNRYRTTGREIADYFVVRRSDFVLVLAVDDDDNMLLVRQYRPATDGFYIALPAGYIEPGETAIEAGRRELFEETGITGSGWRHVGKLDPLPGYVKSRAHVVRCNVSVLPAARTARIPLRTRSWRRWSSPVMWSGL